MCLLISPYVTRVFESSTHQAQERCVILPKNLIVHCIRLLKILYREGATKLCSYQSVIRMEILLDVDGPADMMSAGMPATIWKREPLWILSNVRKIRFLK